MRVSFCYHRPSNKLSVFFRVNKKVSIPAWKECAPICAKFHPHVIQTALNFIDDWIIPSCNDPRKYIHSHTCLNEILLREIKNLQYSKKARLDKDGASKLECTLYNNIFTQESEKLKSCGWDSVSLRAMVNNKMARMAFKRWTDFVPYEQCDNAQLEFL